MTQVHDNYPGKTTPSRQEAAPAAPSFETEPTVDHRSPARTRRRGLKALIAGTVAAGVVGGWFGYDALTSDTSAKGPQPDRPGTEAKKVPGTQTEKAPETKIEFTAEAMPFYTPDGEKLTGVGELNTKIAGVNEGVSDHNKAFQNAMEKQFGILANMNTSEEAVKLGPALTQAEQENSVIAGGVDQMFAEPDSFHQQNRDQAVEFVTSVHNSLVEDANELGTAKDWTDNLRFVVDTSSVDKDGGHEARGHFVPGGMMVEESWKKYFDSHIFVGNMVQDDQGGLRLGGFGIFDKPTQGEN